MLSITFQFIRLHIRLILKLTFRFIAIERFRFRCFYLFSYLIKSKF